MFTVNEIKQAWDKEYRKKGIPSSFRKDPTKTVIEFLGWLKKHRHFKAGLQAADIGCGLGRNSFYLASEGFNVTSLELLDENVNAVNETAALDNLSVKAFAQDASSNWPIPPHSLDIVIDIFCYKHIASKKQQLQYRKELSRTLKKEGHYFISLASEKDGFYGPLLENSKNINEKCIVDPFSNIHSFLYSIDSLIKEFSDYFSVVDIKEQTSTSPMYGKEYSRRVINAIFKGKQ